MIATTQDAETLRAVGPVEFAAYLRSHAWNQVKAIGDRATVWTKQASHNRENEEYEILLPLDRSLSEYARRISEALQTLAVSEQRKELEVWQDITTSSADIIRICIQHHMIQNGTIPFEYGVQMVIAAREVLLAIACTTIHPHARNPWNNPAQAVEYLKGLRMGQTEEGSYILTIQSPVPPVPDDDPLVDAGHEVEEPFERRVLLGLAHDLATVQEAIIAADASGDFQSFQEGTGHDISENLCQALYDLSMEGTAEEISFKISWSPTRRVTEKLPSQFRFGHDAFPIFKEAARRLRPIVSDLTCVDKDERSLNK